MAPIDYLLDNPILTVGAFGVAVFAGFAVPHLFAKRVAGDAVGEVEESETVAEGVSAYEEYVPGVGWQVTAPTPHLPPGAALKGSASDDADDAAPTIEPFEVQAPAASVEDLPAWLGPRVAETAPAPAPVPAPLWNITGTADPDALAAAEAAFALTSVVAAQTELVVEDEQSPAAGEVEVATTIEDTSDAEAAAAEYQPTVWADESAALPVRTPGTWLAGVDADQILEATDTTAQYVDDALEQTHADNTYPTFAGQSAAELRTGTPEDPSTELAHDEISDPTAPDVEETSAWTYAADIDVTPSEELAPRDDTPEVPQPTQALTDYTAALETTDVVVEVDGAETFTVDVPEQPLAAPAPAAPLTRRQRRELERAAAAEAAASVEASYAGMSLPAIDGWVPTETEQPTLPSTVPGGAPFTAEPVHEEDQQDGIETLESPQDAEVDAREAWASADSETQGPGNETFFELDTDDVDEPEAAQDTEELVKKGWWAARKERKERKRAAKNTPATDLDEWLPTNSEPDHADPPQWPQISDETTDYPQTQDAQQEWPAPQEDEAHDLDTATVEEVPQETALDEGQPSTDETPDQDAAPAAFVGATAAADASDQDGPLWAPAPAELTFTPWAPPGVEETAPEANDLPQWDPAPVDDATTAQVEADLPSWAPAADGADAPAQPVWGSGAVEQDTPMWAPTAAEQPWTAPEETSPWETSSMPEFDAATDDENTVEEPVDYLPTGEHTVDEQVEEISQGADEEELVEVAQSPKVGWWSARKARKRAAAQQKDEAPDAPTTDVTQQSWQDGAESTDTSAYTDETLPQWGAPETTEAQHEKQAYDEVEPQAVAGPAWDAPAPQWDTPASPWDVSAPQEDTPVADAPASDDIEPAATTASAWSPFAPEQDEPAAPDVDDTPDEFVVTSETAPDEDSEPLPAWWAPSLSPKSEEQTSVPAETFDAPAPTWPTVDLPDLPQWGEQPQQQEFPEVAASPEWAIAGAAPIAEPEDDPAAEAEPVPSPEVAPQRAQKRWFRRGRATVEQEPVAEPDAPAQDAIVADTEPAVDAAAVLSETFDRLTEHDRAAAEQKRDEDARRESERHEREERERAQRSETARKDAERHQKALTAQREAARKAAIREAAAAEREAARAQKQAEREAAKQARKARSRRPADDGDELRAAAEALLTAAQEAAAPAQLDGPPMGAAPLPPLPPIAAMPVAEADEPDDVSAFVIGSSRRIVGDVDHVAYDLPEALPRAMNTYPQL